MTFVAYSRSKPVPRLISIDPGIESGFAIGYYDDRTPLVFEDAYHSLGGLMGALERMSLTNKMGATVICEKFTPRPHSGKSGLTLKSVEPLRIEGALVALGLMPDYTPTDPRWGQPAAMYFHGGETLAAKKRNLREWLADNGIQITKEMTGGSNTDDAVSATAHMFRYMMDIQHMPTILKYFGPEE